MINAILKLCFVIVQVVCCLIFSSCAPYRCSTTELAKRHFCAQSVSIDDNKVDTAANHWLYYVIPLHADQIYWFDLGHWLTWSILGNEDDGIFGEGPHANYKPCEKISTYKALRWFIRNPFHNLFFYVVGRNTKTPVRRFSLFEVTDQGFGLFCGFSRRSYTFIGHRFGLQCCLHQGLPLISFRSLWNIRRKTEFYIGWRDRVNFGIKLRLFSKTSKKDQKRICKDE